MEKQKVAIIGTGQVGSSFAYALMISGGAREVVLIDRNEKRAMGEAMDLNHGLSFTDPMKIHASDYSAVSDADIIVITAGAAQKPGQSRLDLVKTNTEIFRGIIEEIKKYNNTAILLVVTNPVDILTYVALKLSGFPKERVIGSGTVLDSARFRYLISENFGVDPRSIHAYIIGEHGDSEVPVWSHTNIAGIPINDFHEVCGGRCSPDIDLDKIFDNVKEAAYHIIEGKGSTNYAIGLALVRIIKAILRNENRVLPVSVYVDDYYGIGDVVLSLPSIVSRKGAETVLKMELAEDEKNRLLLSASTLKKIISDLGPIT